ncbi:MAG: VWA domain-containing protein [Deltaproteobacteria bacterium]|nr:VWA domain-containing protein [Deltaproteobacteria bacterium]
MEFARPILFLLLIAVAAAAVFLIVSARRKRRALARFADPAVWTAVRAMHVPGRETLRVVLAALALALLVVGLAGPKFGTVFEEARRRGVDLVVAVDVSKSMLAEDFAPNRLGKAKHQLSALLDKLQGDRVAVMPFAGEAFLLCPLTLDYSAAKLYLGILDADSIPTPGTNLTAAIDTARTAYEEMDRKHKVLLLLTDGESHEEGAAEAAQKAADEGVVIYTIGIGTPDGVPIPVRDDEGNLQYKKRPQGRGRHVQARRNHARKNRAAHRRALLSLQLRRTRTRLVSRRTRGA